MPSRTEDETRAAVGADRVAGTGIAGGPVRRGGPHPATGVWLFPDAPAVAIVAAAHRAEQLGFDEFWLGDEGPARDPFTLLAAAAAVTSRIRLGVAVTNPYVRHAAMTAVSAMTIAELSGGRFVLGIGPGGSISLDPLGIARKKPLSRTRDAVRIIRAVSNGVATDGFTPPPNPFRVRRLPIYIGARGEGFNRFASQETDGVFVGGVPMPVYGLVLGWARSVRPIKAALYVSAVFDPAEEERVRPRLIFGLLDAPQEYRDALGVKLENVQAAAAALAAGDLGPARKIVSDRVFDALALHGSPEEVGRGLAHLVELHRPTSVGVSLLARDPVAALEPAAVAFHHMKEVLA